MKPRDQKSIVEYNEKLINLILDTDSLSLLLTEAARIIDIINQSDNSDIIITELTKSEHYAILQQVILISDYFNQIKSSVAMDLVNFAFNEISDKSHKLMRESSSKKTSKESDNIESSKSGESSDESSSLESIDSSDSSDSDNEITEFQKILCAIWVMKTLYLNNLDSYKILFQPKENKEKPSFTVQYEAKTDLKINQVTYQFLFDPLTDTYNCLRFSPESKDAGIVDSKYLQYLMKSIFSYVRPENSNPFIKKIFWSKLESNEEFEQNKKYKKEYKALFKGQFRELASEIREFLQSKLENTSILNNIGIVLTTILQNKKKKPALMAKLLLDDRLFKLIHNIIFEIITPLIPHIEISQFEHLLREKFSTGIFDFFHFTYFIMESEISDKKFVAFSKFCFEQASQEQLVEINGLLLHKMAMTLSNEDFIKYRKQNKIRYEYPYDNHVIEELYESRPTEFPVILEEMLTSGTSISTIPNKEEILRHYVNLLFKYNGQWFYLIENDLDRTFRENYKAKLLTLAMKLDFQKTLAIIKELTREDSLGNKFLSIGMDAEEITKLICQSPENACFLLDYTDILQTLKNETFSLNLGFTNNITTKQKNEKSPSLKTNPMGGIRRFDLLNVLLRNIPASYGEKLLRQGLLFAECGMPYFQHLTGLGAFGGKTPSKFISDNFNILYSALPLPIFMSALTEGLMCNKNVDRLFLKQIPSINLWELAIVLTQIQHIKHLELTLDLNKDNQNNIIKFFALLSKTNPHLKYYIEIELTEDKERLEFITSYLSSCNIKITSLIINPSDSWIRFELSDPKKPELKNFVDACIKKICQNNPMLRQISVKSLPKSIFFDSDIPEYNIKELPVYNTSIFSLDDFNDFSTKKEDDKIEALLQRNKNIFALSAISNQLRHLQNVLELLPWLAINEMPAELVVAIFDRLNYRHNKSLTTSPYQTILDSIKQSRERYQSNDGEFFQKELIKVENFIKASSLVAYYRFKPHKENLHDLESFFNMNEIQKEVIDIITAWYTERQLFVTKMLDEFRKHNHAIDKATADEYQSLLGMRSSSMLVIELDGFFSKKSPSTSDFSQTINKLHHFQKAVNLILKQLRQEANIEFQYQGPLNSLMQWDTLALQHFDGIEFRNTLLKYNQKEDIDHSRNIFSKLSSQFFTDFKANENAFFQNIMKTLELYLKQKAKSRDKQCDRHKHLHKNKLFDLMKEENIKIFKKSKPRLYQILQTQQKRLSASISKCSVKLVLRHSGLFSTLHEKKVIKDAAIIADYEEQINKKILQ